MTYTFQFEDGSKATYTADTLDAALTMRYLEYGNTQWTLIAVTDMPSNKKDDSSLKVALVGFAVAIMMSACSGNSKIERDFCSENPGHESCVVSANIGEGK